MHRKLSIFFNETANTTSITFGQIGEGMKRASSALSEANNTLSESTALLVAGFDVTRNSEMTATALRSTALRLRGISEEGEDLSELVPQLEAKFNKFGLTLKKDDNTFKSTYEIFKDLAGIWDTGRLTDMDKALILDAVAMKRNSNVIAAVIGNMQTAIDVNGKFATSSGSALMEHKRYMEGVNYAYINLVNTLTELNQKLLNSKTIVEVLNLGTGFVENVAVLGKFNLGLIAIVGALALFTSSARKAILASTEFNIAVSSGGVLGFAKGLKTATLALLGIGTAAKGATFSMTALNIAMGGLLLGLPILFQGIGYLIKRNDELIDKKY